MPPEVLEHLIAGRPLEGLGLARKDGRLDLGGLTVPDPSVGPVVRTRLADVATLEHVIMLRGVAWSGLDFSGARLNGLRFVDCVLRDCVFDRASCKDWRMWSTTISDTRFTAANLRGSLLGGVQDGRRGGFHGVDFTQADLRGTIYKATEFVDCTFRDTRLDKVEFNTSTFTDCRFEGVLREVIFDRTGFQGEAFPPNEMTRVDLSRATLRWVGFRGLDLATVRFPEDDRHVIVSDYRATLDRLIQAFGGPTDLSSRRLATYFKHHLKWAGAHQSRGVISKDDVLEMAGPDGLAQVLAVIAQTPS